MRKANKARGEVALEVAGLQLILCAEMARLEALEQGTGGMGLQDLVAALSAHRVSVLKAAVVALTIEGDAEAVFERMVGVTDLPAIQQAVMTALAPDLDDEGNVAGAAETG